MTTCLLCSAPAVANGLCVTDGARKWAAQKRSNNKPCGVLTALLAGTNDPRESALAEIATPDAARDFLDRLAKAQEDRRAAPLCSRGCMSHEDTLRIARSGSRAADKR